jgi:hypothetical protein
MKTSLLGLAVVASAATAFAQGTVVFNNRVVGSVVTHVYGPNPSDPSTYQIGNGTGDTPAGTVDWSAYPLISGPGFTAQLWAAPGLNQPESSLVAAYPTTTFRTGAGAGFVAGVTATLPNVAGDSTGGATLAMRVWDNAGGAITSWDAAQSSPYLRMESPLFNITAPIGGVFNTPPNLVGLQSFNFAWVPEPATWTLAALGAALLMLFRPRRR